MLGLDVAYKPAKFDHSSFSCSGDSWCLPKFRWDLWCQKTRVPGLLYGVCVILCLAVFCTIPVCDRRTDRETDTQRQHTCIPR